MRELKNLNLLLVLILFSSCVSNAPRVELCIVNAEMDLSCNDKRLDPSSYYRDIVENDIVTNVDDYALMKTYVLDLQAKLKECK